MASILSIGLTTFHLCFDIFRISTLEVDSYAALAAETAASIAMTGAAHYLSVKTKSTVPSLVIGLVQLGFLQHLRSKYVKGRRYRDVDLTGKVFIVTGANAGIGYETCKHLVRMNATVVMACRSAERANEAKEKIVREVKCSPSKIVFIALDLCSLESVRQFASAFCSLSLPLHGLINNAGVMMDKRVLTVDGFETMFAANHLGHFLLTNLLLERLAESAGRVVTLSSVLHKFPAQFNLSDYNAERYYEMFAIYQQTKLANILFTRELHRRLVRGEIGKGKKEEEKGEKGEKEGKERVRSKIFVCSVHPGCVRTEVTRHMNAFMQMGNAIAAPVLSLLQKTPEEGAYTTLYCATDPTLPDEEDKGGRYFFHCELSEESEAGKEEETARRLWELSDQLTREK